MSLPSDLDQHNIQLQRIITRLLNSDVYPELEANSRRIIAMLNQAGDLTSVAQVNRLLREMRKVTTYNSWDAVTGELNDVGVYESGYYAALLEGYYRTTLNVPAPDKVKSYIDRSLMTLGNTDSPKTGTWAQFVQGNIDANASTYDNVIRSGFVRGQTTREMSQAIQRTTNGQLKNWSEALARTGMSHYSERARESMASDNLDVLKKKFLLVTFDNRTSLICMHYSAKSSGNPWLLTDKKAPVLPLHYNERSLFVHLVEGQDEPSGLKPAVGGFGDKQANEIFEARKKRTDKKVRYRGRKDSKVFDVEQVRSSTSYDSWFARQPVWFQNSTLGPTRGKLYRQGGFSLDKFTDMTGRNLTLDELRVIDSDAFERAGLGF